MVAVVLAPMSASSRNAARSLYGTQSLKKTCLSSSPSDAAIARHWLTAAIGFTWGLGCRIPAKKSLMSLRWRASSPMARTSVCGSCQSRIDPPQ